MPERVEPSRSHTTPLRVSELPVPGINLVGFLEAESGLGEIARRVDAALDVSAIEVSRIPFRATLGRQDHPLELELGEEAPYDVNLICLNAEQLTEFAAGVGTELFRRRYSIGVWFWETTVLRNDERHVSSFLDELWVASDYVRRAIVADVDIPVHVVPMPIESPRGPFRTRSELGLGDEYLFLFVFDFWSAERKNATAVVEAFASEFAPGEGPTLVLKSINGRDWKTRQLEELRALAQDRRDILIRDGYVSAGERDSLLACCDCYVSLHRSEGLGLTMAEAMACGKPVIATGYSGNLEFMSEDNSYLVPYHLVDIPETWWAYAPGAKWAEPDVDAASALMRHVYEHQSEASARGSHARAEILDRFSLERASEAITHRLGEARARGSVRARMSPHDARPPILEAVQELSRGAGQSLVDRGGSAPSSFVRRLLHRALWPYLEDQRRFERSVLDSLSALHRSQEELGRRIAEVEDTLGTERPREHA